MAGRRLSSLIGRKIVRIDEQPQVVGDGPGLKKTMHDPIIYLDDGSEIVCVVEEHPEGGEYGVKLIGRRKKGNKP